MTTRAEQLLCCARYLRQPIPEPRPPPRKAQKSFATLQAGQHLELQRPLQTGATRLEPGTRFEVTEPSNLGVMLRKLDGGLVLGLSDRDWKTSGQWTRVRRPTVRKKKSK